MSFRGWLKYEEKAWTPEFFPAMEPTKYFRDGFDDFLSLMFPRIVKFSNVRLLFTTLFFYCPFLNVTSFEALHFSLHRQPKLIDVFLYERICSKPTNKLRFQKCFNSSGNLWSQQVDIDFFCQDTLVVNKLFYWGRRNLVRLNKVLLYIHRWH